MLSTIFFRTSFVALLVIFIGCDKTHSPKFKDYASEYSSEVVVKWLNMQLNMLRVPLAPGTGTQASERAQAYCGITLYEAIIPGIPGHRSLQGQLTDFPAMPAIEDKKKYNWAAVANAALAEMNRKLFPATAGKYKMSIDSLEKEIYQECALQSNEEILLRSAKFGRAVAEKVYGWAATDGSANVNPPYTPSGAPGTWVSTPPNFPAAANPYASQRRLLAPGVGTGTIPEPPPAFSSKPGSPFYDMAKDVYDKSLTLTPEQIAMAIYHRDVPGCPGGGQFVAVLSQVLVKANATLDVAAIAYAKCGIAQSDATMLCFTYKYKYNQVRPITYIRNEMGFPEWSALFNTPGHPEFPAAHAVISAAIAAMLTDVFGDHFQFTLSSYDYLGLPARHYNSFDAMSKEMSDSRVFGGIHYQASCDKGRILGYKVSKNVLSKVRF